MPRGRQSSRRESVLPGGGNPSPFERIVLESLENEQAFARFLSERDSVQTAFSAYQWLRDSYVAQNVAFNELAAEVDGLVVENNDIKRNVERLEDNLEGQRTERRNSGDFSTANRRATWRRIA